MDSTRLRGVFHLRAFSLIIEETEEHNSTALGTTTQRDGNPKAFPTMPRLATGPFSAIPHTGRGPLSELAIDPARCTLMGHSYGGGTVVHLAQQELSVQGCIMLDGWCAPRTMCTWVFSTYTTYRFRESSIANPH